MPDDLTTLAIIKAVSMAIMFAMIMVLGNLPLRWERFRRSSKLISLASAFSGGLFIAVGILHLLPEAREGFDDYYASIGIQDTDEQFPWSNFLCVLCFAFILFIEKVAFASCVGHDHNQGISNGQDEASNHVHLPIPTSPETNLNGRDPKTLPLLQSVSVHPVHKNGDEIQEVAQVRRNSAYQIAIQTRKASMSPQLNGEVEHKVSKLTPYILQVAIGIHATFEGMAIGLETSITSAIGIALAVVCHKWAEGLTLGIAFFKADVELKTATIMIAIQAIMNPIGIMIGWLLSDQGDLIRGIFESISAGTFVYIAAAEVIVNEFNLKRYRYLKFTLFMCALGFVTSLFFIEQAAGA